MTHAPTRMEDMPAVGRHVYVTDDEPGVRMAVVEMLEASGHAAWPFNSGVDLLAALDDLAPGCLVLDVQMRDMDGIAVMQELARRGCAWPVIVMTAHGDVPMAVKAMKLGAFEFIEKPFAPEVVQQAVERALARLACVEQRRAARDGARSRLGMLTPREHNVLDGLIEGKQNKTLAFNLGVSVRTVEMHRANLMSKLGLRTPQEAMALLACAQGGGDNSLSA